MKKVLLALAVMVMSLGFVSCKNSGADLKSIVEKAKTEGSKWTVDEWKTAFKDAVMAVKPAYEKMASVAKKAEGITDASELAKVMEEMQQVQKDNADVDKLMKEFEEQNKDED